MVNAGTLSRSMINRYVGKIRTIFSWGIGEEVVKSDIAPALKAMKALRKGEQGTFDNPPRENVPDDVVLRTLPFLSPTVAAMVQIQRLTGMRPSEIFRMRVGDIDRSRNNGLWYYRPGSYKTERYVGAIEFPLGEDEQKLIAPYLKGKKLSESVFSPRQAVLERRERERIERKTKVSPSQKERDKHRAEKPADRMGEFYNKGSYWKAIQHGIAKGNRHLPDGEKIPRWSPYQLRHSAGTETSLTDGKDKAKALLAHKSIRTTEIYDHSDLMVREELARNRKNPFATEADE
jgi:integrase